MSRPVTRAAIQILCILNIALVLTPEKVAAASPTVVISQVYGGGGNSGAPYLHDFVELFNRGTTAASLAGWSVQYASATGTGNFAGNPIALLSGSLAPGQFYLVQLAPGGAPGAALPTPDATGTANMSATGGKVALVNTATGLACNGGSTACSPAQLAQIVDLVGWDGANFYETSPAPATSNTTSISRNGNGCAETDNNAADFTAGTPSPRNTASSLAVCASACGSAYTHVYDIQGSGPTAAITGLVTTEGVVVGDYEGPSPALRGFYLQDLAGDGDSATSDGIFVFNSNNNDVNPGDVVRVTGTAGDFQGQTQISASSIAPCGTSSVVPVDMTLPFPSADFPEQYEGMLVRLPQTLYVTEHFQLGRFGQIVMSSGDRLDQPTNVFAPGAPAIALQDANDLNRIIVDDESNAQNSDPIRFGRGGLPLSANNTLRGGDTATGIVGVMTWGWAGNSASSNAYRVRPVNALGGGVPNFEPTNPRPSSAPDVGGSLRVVGVDLLNFFNTFDGLPDIVDNCTNGVGGAATDCRGADTAAEFDRQWPKTVAAILGARADVIGFTGMENDGYGPTSAVQFLVDRLNAATAPGTYASVDADAGTGRLNALGTDAVKVGLLYRPASVTPVGQTAALDTVAFVNGGDGAPRNLPSLAQAFEQNSNGARFVVDINRLKSKGSACDAPEAGDGQGNCNAVRTSAATELVSWLATDPTGAQDPDVLILGDLNSYAKEDPIAAIEAAGYANLLAPKSYTYLFDGQWGALDHAFGSPSIASQVAGAEVWHIDADEPSVLDYNTDFKSAGQQVTLYSPDPFRSSDHDLVVVGLDTRCEETPPTLALSVTPDTLWPANHKYVQIKATAVATDNLDPTPTVTLVSLTSSEPDNGLGDGDAADDVVILGNFTFNLRAERSGAGSGRIYTITYEATDSCGNSTVKTATVSVPQSKDENK